MAQARRANVLSSRAVKDRKAQRPYPALETWMNPVTRGLARRLANQIWLKTLHHIDFEYRLTNIEIAGVPCVHYETEQTTESDTVILYVHGGAFLAGSPQANAATVLPLCALSGIEAIGVDYTLLPEGRFPIPIDEVDRVYKSVLGDMGKRRIIILADSIGGTIALSSLVRWRDENAPLPECVIFLSPVMDGAGASDTHKTQDSFDPLIQAYGGKTARRLFRFYAPGKSPLDPQVSPIYADLDGLPPMLIHVGTREIALGDASRLAILARRSGVEAEIQVFDGLFHLFHMNWSLAETKLAFEDIAAFVDSVL